MLRSGERGIAIIVALFMVLITSAIGMSMMAVAQTETLSTVNYRTTSQVRYAAESGVAVAVNYLLYTYTLPETGSATDPIAAYDLTVSPVTSGGTPAVLSSEPDVASNYPVAAVQTAFDAATQGTLDVGNGLSAYTTSATLVSMFEFTNAVTGGVSTLQTWEITGVGTKAGLGAAEVQISATLEQPLVPIFAYAAFGTGSGCDVLDFAGGGSTDSYDSGALVAALPVVDTTGGNVGTNGNLALLGGTTTINGILATPRAGVGDCTATNVTAVTIAGNGTVTEGLAELPQQIEYEDPEPIVPTPPTSTQTFTQNSGCPAAAPYCTPDAGTGATITPLTAETVVSLGNMIVEGGAELHLGAGIYEINSLSLAGNATLIIDSGPVIFRIEGDGVAAPIDLTGGTISNASYVSSDLQFIYGGTGNITVSGGVESSALIYAPNADVTVTGNADFYGSVIGGTVTIPSGAAIHYDRALGTTLFKPGNISLTTFNWESF